MDLNISLILLQDGIVYGAIYGMLAVAVILVFSVTRVVLFFEGELIAFSALTMIALTAGRIPGMLPLLLIFSAISAVNELVRHCRHLNGRVLGRVAAVDIAYPALVYALVTTLARQKPGMIVSGGYGFPAHRGGPIYMADQIGLAVIVERLQHYANTRGNRFGYWTPSNLLLTLARDGKRLSDWTSQR